MEDQVRNHLRTLVDRDHDYEYSKTPFTLDNLNFDVEVSWLIDKPEKMTVIGSASGFLPTEVNDNGGVFGEKSAEEW